MPAPKSPGDLRQRVKFQRRTERSDNYGNTVAEWVDLGIVRACSLHPTRGGESIQAGRLAGNASWDLWLPYDSQAASLRTSDRVVDTRDETRTFNIVFGPEDMNGDRRWLLAQVVSGGADG